MPDSTPSKLRRTWPQRLTLVFVIVVALGCFAAAGALASGQYVLSQRQLVELAEPDTEHGGGGPTRVLMPGDTTTLPSAGGQAAEPEIVLAEPDAANFLVTGADNGDCEGDAALAIGERDDLGERADVIMVWRANPESDQLAVLSLPRDLYVEIAGGRQARINSAYRRNDPSRLIDTIYLNFGIPIDHYIQVDFCAFRRLVDAVGGVTIPFDAPARDQRAGLSIPEAGCVELDGDMALAYVRSRHYTYEDPPGSGVWRQDGTSDFGRIARQQDFLRRLLGQVIDEGLTSPSVATALIETNREYLVTDSGLTVNRMLEFANTLRRLDPGEIATYRVESSTETRGGQSVEIPRVKSDNMQAILAIFQGVAQLADAPDQVFQDGGDDRASATTAPATSAASDDDGDGDDGDRDDGSSGSSAATTLPTVVPDDNSVGVVPGADLVCD